MLKGLPLASGLISLALNVRRTGLGWPWGWGRGLKIWTLTASLAVPRLLPEEELCIRLCEPSCSCHPIHLALIFCIYGVARDIRIIRFCACRIRHPAQNLGSCAELRKIYQIAQKTRTFSWFLLTLSLTTVKITQYTTRC